MRIQSQMLARPARSTTCCPSCVDVPRQPPPQAVKPLVQLVVIVVAIALVVPVDVMIAAAPKEC